MQIKVLSHACLLISTHKTSLIIDPWLLGSCYWRSWWNFPEPELDPTELGSVDAVIISHIHWDHWHGPTLKRLFKGKPIYVPDEPGLRSERDLRSIGFDRVHRIPHGKTVKIGDMSITMHQFGLYLNDAAIVIEADGVRILNANDAKIAGLSLRGLLAHHGKIDFALRSHSSANARVCYKLQGREDFRGDDREHYFRAFHAFMEVVKPRYAVPFASNHCHLHDDVYDLNGYISNPLQLREFVQGKGASGWSMAMMLPGSSWSKDGGFKLRDEACFNNLPAELAAYRQRMLPILQAYVDYENAVQVTETTFSRFQKFLSELRFSKAASGHFRITVRWPDGRFATRLLTLPEKKLELTPATMKSEGGIPNLLFPAVVFRDAVVKNMFHHAAISKRCEFIGSTEADLERVRAFFATLENAEHGSNPMRWPYVRRLLTGYFRRWRELFVYAHALWLLRVRKTPIYLAEEAILRGEF